MQILCPKCHFAREIPDDKVPANAKVATCPKCKIKFQFRELPEDVAEVPPAGSPPPSPAATAQAATQTMPGQPAPRRHVPSAPPAQPQQPATPPLPGSRQQLAASRAALRPPAAPGEPGEGIWNRLEAMSPESTPPPFDPDALDMEGPAGQPSPPPHGPAHTPGFARQVPNPLEEAAAARDGEGAGNDPDFLRYTRARNTRHPSADTFAQPSYFRERASQAGQAGRGGRHGEVPWEHMSEHGGFFSAIVKTIKRVLLQPSKFFAEMPIGHGVSKPLGFAMILGTFNALVSVIWEMLGLSLQSMQSNEMLDAAGGMLLGMSLGIVVATPLIIALGLCINAFLVTLALRLLKAAHGGFEGSFRALAYGTAVGVLGIVPILGPIAAALWGLVLMFISLKHVHNTTYGKVFLSWLLLFVVLMVILFAFGLLLGLGLSMLKGAS
ncbi:YIP1 family protein [Megalodesulfovibrio paquesii]